MGFFKKIKKAIKKIVTKVKNTIKKIVRATKDIIAKLGGIFDQFLSLFGIRPKKYLRLYIIILKENDIAVVHSDTVYDWYRETKRILKERCNIEVSSPNKNDKAVTIADGNAPDYALEVACNFGAGFGEDADYFESLLSYARTSIGSAILDLLGYGEPLYVIVTKNFSGDEDGCAMPFINNYIVLTENPKGKDRTMVHEIGHVAWLKDRYGPSNKSNVMYKKSDRGDELTNYQISSFRNNRYVVYIPRSG